MLLLLMLLLLNCRPVLEECAAGGSVERCLAGIGGGGLGGGS